MPESSDRLPLTWWRGRPVYLAGILALVAAASMVVTALLGIELASGLMFSHDAFFRRYHVWTLLTWPLMNFPSVWTLVGCVMLWRFGEDVERHLGRRVFVRLLLLLWFLSPALIAVMGMLGYTQLYCAGIFQIEFAVFIAFATLYPQAKLNVFFAVVDVWVLAALFAGLNVLSCLAGRQWAELILLIANLGAAWAMIRYETGHLSLPKMPSVISEPKSKPAVQSPLQPKPATLSVDDILDKISSSGMHSLSAEERRILDKASQDMQKRKS